MILAFSAGFLSFLSPCVLPMIPAYVSYLTGNTVQDIKDEKPKLFVLYKATGFIIGFSAVFMLMGLSVTTIGNVLITHKELFRKIGGILIFAFGIHTMGIFRFKILYREKRFIKTDKINGTFSAVLLGIAFGAGWTPCVGPVLSSILIYAASTESIGRGTLLLGIYSLGLAVPFLFTALAIKRISQYLRKVTKYLPVISVLSGVLLIIMGILIYTNKVAVLSQYVSFLNI